MLFTSPGQTLFSIFGLNIYYYGIVLAVAICVGILVSDYAGEKYFGLKKEMVVDIAPYLIIFGIIGARLYYCMMDFEFYSRFPSEILAVRHGGISIHGAILGGICGLLIFAKRHKVNALKLMDVCALSLPLAQSIGRWGNFFNSEAYGLPTTLPWKLYIAPEFRHIPYLDCEFYHPAFLYESILDFIIFVILFLLLKNGKFKKNGQLVLIYLILYSIVRIIVESCRFDSVRYVFGLPVAIFVSICIIVVALSLFIKSLKANEPKE